MSSEAPISAPESRKLSNAEGLVKLAIDFLHYSPRRYLRFLKERPVATVSLTLAPPTFVFSLVNAGIGFPVFLGETLGYIIGDQVVWSVKEGFGNVKQWWSRYKNS